MRMTFKALAGMLVALCLAVFGVGQRDRGLARADLAERERGLAQHFSVDTA